MAMVDVHAEKPLLGTCISKSQRQTSDASTALPSPEFTRMVSPTIYDSELDEAQQFTLDGLSDDSCEVPTMQQANPISPSLYSIKHVRNPGAVPGGMHRACVPLCLIIGALCQYHYGTSTVSIFSVIMGASAVFMILPGTYLYVVQGCRPEDCEEVHGTCGNDMDKKGRGAEACVLLNFTLGALSYFYYGISVVNILGITMGFIAALMILPGAYLYIIQGCRPEDCEECRPEDCKEVHRASGNEMDKNGRGAEACVLLVFTIGALYNFHYGISVVSILGVTMGLIAALMILPGAYLYIIRGCRPEDCEE
jgi:hypothetical protein